MKSKEHPSSLTLIETATTAFASAFPRAVRAAAMMKPTTRILTLCVSALAVLPASPAARAESVTVSPLHEFAPLYSDGSGAQSVLIVGNDGNFYGTTLAGGSNGNGTVFRLTPAGALTVLHNFATTDTATGTNTDGKAPAAGLVLGGDGAFYGTAQSGGTHATGTVFKITTAGAFTTLHSFNSTDNNGANTDGANPSAALIQAADGKFYGTAVKGGANGTGAIFSLTASGTFTSLRSFSARDGSSHNGDGAAPFAGLIQAADGNLYGAASTGGDFGNGTIFQITTLGTLTTLHSFSAVNNQAGNSDGTNPYATLVQGPDGKFFGTAIGGGSSGNGTVFRITSSGAFSTLHSFSALDVNGQNSDGAFPTSSLVANDTNSFYGTAASGGGHANGAIFQVASDGSFSNVHSFDAVDIGNHNNDGAAPYAGLVQGGDGNYYGATTTQGFNGNGTVYQLNDFTKDVTVLHHFSAGFNAGGATPYASLLQGSDGNFYGPAELGGANGTGTIYKLSAAGNFSTLRDFTALDSGMTNTDGETPAGRILQASDGNYYGTTSSGGAFQQGTAFKITPAGVLTTLHNFGSGTASGGSTPACGLIQGIDGNFYGTALLGGTSGNGTVFKMTAAGVVTVLHYFSATDQDGNNADGTNPYAALVQGSDGNFYGTASAGGTSGGGTVFQITPAGTFTTLHNFSAVSNSDLSNTDGFIPSGALIEGAGGSFIGMATYGGANGNGTVFAVSASKDFGVLHHFGTLNKYHNADGAFPAGSMLLGQDGLLYGTATYGGANGFGTIFRVTIFGVFTTLHDFAGTDGTNPSSALLQDGKGTFYGTTVRGGGNGTGTVFTMVFSPAITSGTTAMATQGVPFSYQVTATNNPTAYKAGGLPKGLRIDTATGKITGTATATGSYKVFITATNSAGSDTITLALTVNGAKPAITSALTATATQGSAFSYTITATNGPTKYGESGVPAGLTINQTTGVISGSPTAAGTFTVTIAAFNSTGVGSAKLTLTVNPSKPVVTSTLTATAVVGDAFIYQITAKNSPATYGASGLPPGLSINQSTGKISGTPTTPGTYMVTIAAFNNLGSGSAKLTLTVNIAKPVVTSATTAAGKVGTPFNYQITASHNPTSYGAAGLPAGLSINQSTGKISGTPTKAGTFTVTIAAFNSSGSGQAKLTLTVQ